MRSFCTMDDGGSPTIFSPPTPRNVLRQVLSVVWALPSPPFLSALPPPPPLATTSSLLNASLAQPCTRRLELPSPLCLGERGAASGAQNP